MGNEYVYASTKKIAFTLSSEELSTLGHGPRPPRYYDGDDLMEKNLVSFSEKDKSRLDFAARFREHLKCSVKRETAAALGTNKSYFDCLNPA